MDKALLVDIPYTDEPYAVRVDPAQLVKKPDGTYGIAGGAPGAHGASHAAAGADPVTLGVAQVTGLSAALAPLSAATPAGTPNTLALRDAEGAAEFGGVQVDTTPAVAQAGAPGKMVWNAIDGTIEFQLKGGNVTLQLGQEQVLRVRNAEATTLVDGEVVYLSGSTGVHNTAWRASNLTEPASARTIGVVTEHIAAGADGYVTTFGMVRGLNTNHLTEGALVYLGTAGATSVTAAVPPAHNVVVGYCVKKSGGNGAIFVHVQNGFELHELHDVLLGVQAEGDTLAWDDAVKVWRNRTPAGMPWLPKDGSGQMTGDLRVINNAALTMSQAAVFNLTRTLPSAAGDYVELGDFTNSNFAANLEVWYNVHNGGYSQSKRYFMPLSYNATAGTWQKALPISTTGAYSGYDTDLEIRVTNLVASLRLRRTTGFFPNAVADVVLLLGGSADETTWTPTTGTGTGVAPTTYYQVRAEGFNAEFLGAGVGAIPFTNRPLLQAGNVPVQVGAYSLSSWNGTGARVPIFAACPSNNGGATPAVAQPVVVLGRDGVGGVAYANFAEIKLRRVSAVGVEARTGLTIALTHGSNAAAGTDVLDILSDGRVGVGMLLPTAVLQLKAGTATAGTAPLKLTSGTLNTAPEAGAVEFDGSAYYLTVGTTRRRIALITPPTPVTAGPYTVLDTDETLLVSCTTLPITIDLPSAVQSGRKLTVKKVDSTGLSVTIDASGAQTIDGDLTQVLTTRNSSITMQADGASWWII